MSKLLGNVSAYAYAVSQGYTGTEEEFAELMASYASVAEAAAASAESAAGSATSASGSASAASAKATEAANSASAAATSASNAAASATNAAGSASAAAGSASTASGKANEASASATAAAGSASTASAKAGEAATSAANATASATAAGTAKTGAETAQTAAETAQAAAETAAASVSASAAQIETNKTDITHLKQDISELQDDVTAEASARESADEAINAELATKANIDGSYEQMTVGNAEQLVSSIKEEDKVPYIFRTSGGSIDIGDREEDKIVGGTVAWNQLISNGNFLNGTTGWNVYSSNNLSISANNGVLLCTTLTEKSANYLFGVVQLLNNIPISGHKYFATFQVKSSNAMSFTIELGGGNLSNNPLVSASANTWTAFNCIGTPSVQIDERFMVKPSLGSTSVGGTIEYKNIMLFDLTQMFGTAIADRAYALEQTTAGSGIAWLKSMGFFTKDYYPYDAGSLKSVEGLIAHSMVGFNQWDEEWEVGTYSLETGAKGADNTRIRSKNFTPCVPGATYYGIDPTANYNIRVLYYDANKNYITRSGWIGNQTFTTPNNCYFFTFFMGTAYGTTYNHDICFNLSWDGSRNGEYKPYVKHSYPLDSTLTLRGTLKLDENYQVYYDGDEYASDGTVKRRYGIVDLGTLNWSYSSTRVAFDVQITNRLVADTVSFICAKYITGSGVSSASDVTSQADKALYYQKGNTTIFIKDSAYTDAATFKTAMSGVYLVYELATSTTEEADPYQNPQIVDDFGTEEYVIDSTVTIPIPVGHDTFYQANLVAKLEMAPNSPNGDGDYIVRQTNGENAYVPITFPADELPAAPTGDGTYYLKCTVASGTATFTWEAQS